MKSYEKYFIVIAIIIVNIFVIAVFMSKGGGEDVTIKTFAQVKDKSKRLKESKRIIDEMLKKDKTELTPEEKIIEEKKSEQQKIYEELTEEEKDEIDAKPREEEIPFEEIDNIIEEQDNNDDIPKEIPDYFNLKDVIPIKTENQEQRGLCWAFASSKSLETFLSLRDGKVHDFSEQHINYMTSNLLYGNRVIDDGGSFGNYVDYLIYANPIEEEKVPYYKDYVESEYSLFYKLSSDYYVTETVNFPTIWNAVDKYDMEKITKFREAVKKHIMVNGSVYATINSQQGYNTYVDINSPNQLPLPNHAISIVGWDDNYPKENFTYEGAHPRENGAYIALNSWGDFYTDPITNTYTPYFYISYEDAFVESNMSGIKSTTFDESNSLKISSISNKDVRKFIGNLFNHTLIEKDNEKYLRKIVTNNIYSLFLKGSGDIDFNDLKIFNNLYTLSVEGFNIPNISSINNLDKLTNVILTNNNLKDVSDLKDLKSLYSLWITNNKDVSGYGKLSQLYELVINDSNLNELEEFENDKLLSLNLSNNNINSISKLPESINDIYLNNNNISSLENINLNYPKLINVSLKDNNLTNLDGLNNSAICDLNLENNKIEDLSLLSNNKCDNSNSYYMENGENSFALNINNNNISDLSIVNGLDLYNLYATNNNIEDLSNYVMSSNLQYLYLDNNKISDISTLNIPHHLYDLSLENNNINDASSLQDKDIDVLNLSKNKDIKNYSKINNVSVLRLNDCNITELEEFNNNIRAIYLDDNNIKDFSILEPLELDVLSINNNKENININASSYMLYAKNTGKIEKINNDRDLILLIDNKEYTKESLNLKDNVYINYDNVEFNEEEVLTINIDVNMVNSSLRLKAKNKGGYIDCPKYVRNTLMNFNNYYYSKDFSNDYYFDFREDKLYLENNVKQIVLYNTSLTINNYYMYFDKVIIDIE